MNHVLIHCIDSIDLLIIKYFYENFKNIQNLFFLNKKYFLELYSPKIMITHFIWKKKIKFIAHLMNRTTFCVIG